MSVHGPAAAAGVARAGRREAARGRGRRAARARGVRGAARAVPHLVRRVERKRPRRAVRLGVIGISTKGKRGLNLSNLLQ